jgi:ankyrin repeat protein
LSCDRDSEPDPITHLLFFKAIREGDLNLVKRLCKEYPKIGKYIIATEDTVLAPLPRAAEYNNTAIFLEVLRAGGDINSRDTYGQTALLFAVGRQNMEIVEVLFEKGADINIADINSTQPIHMAVLNGDIKMARMLLDRNANLDVISNELFTPLMLAVNVHDLELDRLLLSYGADPFQIAGTIDNKINVVMYAAILGDTNMMSLFISEGYKINEIDYPNGVTPLHIAVAKSDYEMSELLIGNGMNVNSGDKAQKTPLHLAASLGHNNVAILLLEHSADAHKEDQYGITPLDEAIKNGNDTLVTIMRGNN